MNEGPTAIILQETITTFDHMCQKIQRLYPGIHEIQFFENKNKYVCFWVITRENTLDAHTFIGIQQAILTEFSKHHKELKCSVHNIHQVSIKDISSQSEVGKRYITELTSQVISKFPKDSVHIIYKNSKFFIYGVALRDHTAVYGKIISSMPSILPCSIQFRSGADWDEAQNITTTIDRANAAFSGVDVPDSSGIFSGVSLLLGQLQRVFGSKIFPK